MTATPHIDEKLETDQLSARAEQLEAENEALRQGQSPAAGAIDLQAENVVLRREVEMLQQTLPEFVPHDGPPPATLAEFNALPAAHRRQVLRQRPDDVRRLQEADALLRQADRLGRQEAARQACLSEAEVGTVEELASLPAERRRQIVLEMTPQQRRALLGLGADTDEARSRGYL